MKIKKGDTVEVVAGKDSGKQGRVCWWSTGTVIGW